MTTNNNNNITIYNLYNLSEIYMNTIVKDIANISSVSDLKLENDFEKFLKEGLEMPKIFLIKII